MPDAPKTETKTETKTTSDPHLSAIESCLGAIRARLYMVRAFERLVLGLIFGGTLAASLVLTRFLKERFPLYSELALFFPLVLIAIYWLVKLTSDSKNKKSNSILDMIHISGITAVLVVTAAAIFWSGFWFSIPLWIFAAAPLAVFGVFAFFAGKPVSPQSAAIFVDRQAGLQEKVSTAFEMLQRGAITPAEARFQAPLVADAATACKQVRASKVGYARMDRRLYLAAFLMAIGVFAFTLITPLPALAARIKPKLFDPNVAIAHRDLEERLKELEKEGRPKANGVDPLAGLKATLENSAADADPREALAQAGKEIDKLSSELDKYKSADKTTQTLSQDKQLGEFGQALSKFDQTMTKEGQGGSPEAKANARAAAENAIAAAAKNLAGKLADGKLSETDKQMIQNTLNAAKENAKGDPELQAAIDRAKEALANGDAKSLEKILNEIGTRIASNIGDKHANQESYASARSALQQFSGQLKGDKNNGAQMANNGGERNPQNGGQPNGGQQANGQQNGGQPNGGQQANGQQNGGQPNGGQQANGQQNGGQPNGGQQAGGQQAGGQQAGGQQAGGQQAGGQQAGGQQAGGQQAGGQQAGGQQAGGQQAGGQQAGGQQAGGQQAGGQQAGGQQAGGQQAGGQQAGGAGGQQAGGQQAGGQQAGGQQAGGQQAGGQQAGGQQAGGQQAGGQQAGGKEQGGSKAGGEQAGGGGMERQQSATAGGEQLIDGQEQAGGEQAGGEQAGGEQTGGEQAGGQQAGQQPGNDGGGKPNGQQAKGAGQQGGGQKGAGQQGAGAGQQPGMGQGMQAGAGQKGMGQGGGSNGAQSTNQFSPGGSSNDSGSQGVVGTMTAKGEQVVTVSGEKVQVRGEVDKTVKPDSATPFMAPAEKQDKTFMGYDPSAMQNARQNANNEIGTGRVSPKHRDIVRDFFNPDAPQPK